MFMPLFIDHQFQEDDKPSISKHIYRLFTTPHKASKVMWVFGNK